MTSAHCCAVMAALSDALVISAGSVSIKLFRFIAPASATSLSFFTLLPDTPTAPTILSPTFNRTPPGKVIRPWFECSIPYRSFPGCESSPSTCVSISKNLDVLAFLIEISMLPNQAPSSRVNAFRFPPASTTAIFIFVPNS